MCICMYVCMYVCTYVCIPWVHEHHMGGCCQVESHSTSLQAHEEHPHIRVVCELLNHAIPVVHTHAAL